MSGQVYLNPSRLSILSIPREKVWIFSAAILKHLHREAQDTPQSIFKSAADINYDHSFESDSSSDNSSDSSSRSESGEVGNLTASMLSELSLSKKSLITRNTSGTDNSSKSGPVGSSSESLSKIANNGHLSDSSLETSEEDHRFFHIAYTPSECTVILSSSLVKESFGEPLEACKKLGYNDVVLLEHSYLNLQVDSEGDFNNSAKILELTKPLSQHNISLFFLSTHFTNIVLIPYDLKNEVIEILIENDFMFSDVSNSYISNKKFQDTKDDDLSCTPSTPETITNMTTKRCFTNASIMPKIHRKVKLLLTGARPGEVKQSIIKAAQCVAADAIPNYFAVTRSSFNEISLILPGSAKQRARMGFDFRSIIGSASDVIIPIAVDLSDLPIDSAGIVAGLASTLWESVRSVDEPSTSTFEMNYLSMARSAVVMIPQENLAVVTEMINRMKAELVQDSTTGENEENTHGVSTQVPTFI